MSGKKAKILSDEQINTLLVHASAMRHPVRNRTLVLLSVKAGLRAAEIAKITWDMLLDPSGSVGPPTLPVGFQSLLSPQVPTSSKSRLPAAPWTSFDGAQN